MTRIAITGNTYPVREQLRALGGRWNADGKAWMVPADQAETARKLVAGAPVQARRHGSSHRGRGTWTGCSCGSVHEYARASDCFSCRHDR